MMTKQTIEETLQKSLKEASDYKYALEESSIVAITDQKGIITYVNSNFCKISQFSAEELIGQNHRIVNSGFHSKEFMKNLWTTIANGKVWKGEIKNKAKDGSIYWVDTTIVPLLNDDGKPIKYIAIRYDITERKKAEQKISNLTERLILATSSAKIGIWDWDIPSNNLIWDLNMYEIFGIEIDKFSGAFEAWENTVHPDDLQKALEDVQQALDGTQNFNSSFRILWPNNIVKYIEGQAIVLRDQEGKAIRMIGVNRDITDRKEAEMEMLHLINNTEEAFILLNNQLKIVSFNNQFKNLYKKYLGLEIQKGRSIFDYAQLERKELVKSIYQKVLAGNVEESEINIPTLNAETKTFHIKYNPAKDELGKVIGVFVTASDITEKKKEEEQKEFDRRDKEALINSTDD